MSHQLHSYPAQQLDKALRRDRVVVFYDARSEFEPCMAELKVVGTGVGGLPRTRLGDTLPHMVRFGGSFFALKDSIEPLISADKPEALLIYLPGQARDRVGSVLMEVERAGQVYGDAPSHALKNMARLLLRKEYIDGDIDEMLRPDSLSYHDVVRFLGQGGSGSSSLVELVLTGQSSEGLITDWIVSKDEDEALAVVADRGHSFWVDQPGSFGRLVQWEACRLIAELEAEVEVVRPRARAPMHHSFWTARIHGIGGQPRPSA